MIDFNNEEILLDCLETALNHCDGVVKRGDKYNFRCNVCGDSHKSLKKKRGWLQKNSKGIWVYRCYNNSECCMGASFWLKKFFPQIYSQYIRNLIGSDKKEFKPTKKKILEVPKQKCAKTFPFKKIDENSDSKLMKDVINYCEKRKISKDIWKMFFVCEQKTNDNGQPNPYYNRLIIPFYNKEGKIYYFVARTLYGEEPKYICAFGKKQIYNFYNIDETKPVMMCEGNIDCLFLENSIAITGLQISLEQEKQIENLNLYYLLDGDESGRKKSLEFLSQGKFVFNWRKFLKEHNLPEKEKYDVNQLYIELGRTENFTFKELEPYFTNDIYSKNYFK